MPRYRKKPVVIAAERWNPDGPAPSSVCYGNGVERAPGQFCRSDGPHIHTLEGILVASPGDYIVTGVKGEVYPCRGDIFEATYDQVDDDTPLTVA